MRNPLGIQRVSPAKGGSDFVEDMFSQFLSQKAGGCAESEYAGSNVQHPGCFFRFLFLSAVIRAILRIRNVQTTDHSIKLVYLQFKYTTKNPAIASTKMSSHG